MPVLGGRAMLDSVNRKDLDHWHIRKGSRKTRGFHSSCGWLPPEKAWSDFVYNLVRYCKGRVRYYEIVNEPNLYMTPEDYTRYLKLAYEAAKKADPACRIVGICSTGDLGGRLGDFIEACGKRGAFRSLDILSFHPYSAQLDSSPSCGGAAAGNPEDRGSIPHRCSPVEFGAVLYQVKRRTWQDWQAD